MFKIAVGHLVSVFGAGVAVAQESDQTTLRRPKAGEAQASAWEEARVAGSAAATEDPTTTEQRRQDGFEIETITVTARRRDEGLLQAPIAVTALQGEQLKDLGVADTAGLSNIAPNVMFRTTGTVSGSSSAAVVYIRGIGQNDYTPVTDPGVGIYVDDVYLGRTLGSVLDLMDVKSVEVIRGPQGTLFGRNSIGGAISITSNDPREESGGSLRLISGDYNRLEAFATVHIPLKSDLLSALTVMRRIRDGYVERVNVTEPGADALGNDDSTGLRLKVLWRPLAKLSLRLTGDYIREREESAPEQNRFFRDGVEMSQGLPDRTIPRLWNSGVGASTASGCVLGDPTRGTNCYNESLNLGPFKTSETSLSQSDLDARGLSLTSDYVLASSIKAKLVLAHRQFDANIARQVDGSALNLFENHESYNQYQRSADLRVSGQHAYLDWIAGAFYFTEGIDNQLDFGGVLSGVQWPVHFGGLVENTNVASYGEATYHVISAFDLSAGLRYTNEKKRTRPNAFSYVGGDVLNPPQGPESIRDADTNPTRLIDQMWQEIMFDRVTWRVNAAYEMAKWLNSYATVSTGFKSGGFEWRVTNTAFYDDSRFDRDGDGDGDLPVFAPETVTSYELGLKAEIKPAQMRVNLAGFYSDYNNIQIATNPDGSIATFQANAASGAISGAEAEVQWVPRGDLFVNAALGHTNARYKELAPGVTISLDDQFILTPKWSAYWGVAYRFDYLGLRIKPRLDGWYKSETHYEARNSQYVVDDGHVAVNAAIRVDAATDSLGELSFRFGVENATDELYIIGGDANTTIGYENVIYARPRTWYLSLEHVW